MWYLFETVWTGWEQKPGAEARLQDSGRGGPLGQNVFQLFTHVANGFFGGFPVDTGVGDGYAVFQVSQVFWNRLTTPVDVAFHHQALDRLIAFQNLVCHILHYQRLNSRILAGVGVAAIDHNGFAQLGLVQCLFAQGNADGIVVWFAATTTKHHMAVVVALGANNGNFALLIDAQEAVGMRDRLHGVNRNVQAAVGAVVEANGHGQATADYPVGLGLGGTGADGRPGNGILQILGRNWVQSFGSGRKTH